MDDGVKLGAQPQRGLIIYNYFVVVKIKINKRKTNQQIIL